jgi:hypothetical protein
MATPIRVNRIGLEPQIYKGGKTTLCAGCGHNAISERIIDAFYEMGIDPKQQTKLRSILHYNGLPIDARSISDDLLAQEGFEVAKKTARMSAGTAGGE